MLGRIWPSLLKRDRLDYLQYWVGEEGKDYRKQVYLRQSSSGEKPLASNPSFLEIREVLDAHRPKRVLEVGCGWGRILSELDSHYEIEGCDISDEYLSLVPKHLKVFKLDVVSMADGRVMELRGRWDVLFCRGLMLYLMEKPGEMKCAMVNMEAMAKTKVIIWEWSHVCDRMRTIHRSDKFEYHAIALLDE